MSNITLTINGGGFTYDGTISKIYLDQDGKAPYDVTLEVENNQYKVVSDKKITQVSAIVHAEIGSIKRAVSPFLPPQKAGDRASCKRGKARRRERTKTYVTKAATLQREANSLFFKSNASR